MKRKTPDPNRRRVGIFRNESGKGYVRLAEKGGRRRVAIPSRYRNGTAGGELVVVQQLPGRERQARIVERLGERESSAPFSLIAIKANDVPCEFPDSAMAEARAVVQSNSMPEADLTGIPFITIDPPDARDRDDAVCAEPDMDPANAGGHIVWVAVADVARFVTGGSELDRQARLRGNSTYFPDLTVPMLPADLCENACSLHEGAERACIVVRAVIDRDGNRLSHEFRRGRIRSRAALHYAQAQTIADTGASTDAGREVPPLVGRLWAAFRSLENASRRREPLRLELAERRIRLSASGHVESVITESRLDSHRLIEEFMVLANVCAAETLDGKQFRTLSRVHAEPDGERIAELARTAVSCELPLATGSRMTTRRVNELLGRAEHSDCRDIISLAVLRSMNQARYSTAPARHFGLNLRRYAHFTSPIRRYADLVVHRSLIRALDLGQDGLTDSEMTELDRMADHVSMTERRSMAAEREAHDRFAAQFMVDRVGAVFDGTVTGTARQGVFVRLQDTGSEGLIRRSKLGKGRFHYNRVSGTLFDLTSGRSYRPGMPIRVRLSEAEPISGTLQFELPDEDERAGPGRFRQRGRKRAGRGRK